jgi:hypothetical protein
MAFPNNPLAPTREDILKLSMHYQATCSAIVVKLVERGAFSDEDANWIFGDGHTKMMSVLDQVMAEDRERNMEEIKEKEPGLFDLIKKKQEEEDGLL